MRTVFSDQEHKSVMFQACQRPLPDRTGCVGGRVFWQPAEPQWRKELGYVGLCSHCGWQVFTCDLLGYAADEWHGRGVGKPASRYIGGLRTAA